MLLKDIEDIGFDVDIILYNEREQGVNQCTFIFTFDYESDAIDKRDSLFTSICEQSERRFAFTEVRIGDPDVIAHKLILFECVGDITIQYQEDGKWWVIMVGVQKPYRPDQEMGNVG